MNCAQFRLKRLIFFTAFIICISALAGADDFFPIGMFSVGAENLGIVKNAGFNTAHTYITDPAILQKYFDIAEKTGIKLLMYPADRADKGAIDFDKVKQFIEKNRNAKSILAWYIADEPELNGGSPEQIKSIHSFITKLDPGRSTAIVIHRSDRYKEYRDASDILMIDRYPVPKTPLNHIAEATRWAGIQKGDTGPVWTILQAFGYQNLRYQGWGSREPTYDEMRAMTFLSIIYGAKGIFYFTFTGSQYRIMESPQHWNDLKQIVRELNGIYPLLLAGGDYNKVKVEITDGPQKDDRGLLPVHISETNLLKEAGEFKAGKYFIAANSTSAMTTTRFFYGDHEETQKGVVAVLGEKRSLTTDGRSFADIFKPYDVHIYRLLNDR